MVFESKEHEDILGIKNIQKVSVEAETTFADWEFYTDLTASGNVHKLLVPGDEVEIDDLLVLNEVTGDCEHIGHKSQIIGKIPKRFHVVRIYAYPKEGDLDDAKRKDSAKKKNTKTIWVKEIYWENELMPSNPWKAASGCTPTSLMSGLYWRR